MWYKYFPERNCMTLTLHVQPNAKQSGIAGLHGDALKIRLSAQAIDGRANKQLIEYMSSILDIPTSRFRLLQGEHNRRKVLEICSENLKPETLTALLHGHE